MLSAPTVKFLTGLPLLDMHTKALQPLVLAKALSVSMTSTLNPDLNSTDSPSLAVMCSDLPKHFIWLVITWH
jgi:hypothetical protein